MHTTALRYFLEVARVGSLNQAAETLHIAASAISRQIAKLEDEIQVQLFERRPNGMVLSDAGQKLATYARLAQLDQERIIHEVRQLAIEGVGLIRIASIGGIARNFLPRAMDLFRAKYSKSSFVLLAVGRQEAIDMVRNGEADLGITLSTKPADGVHVEYSARAPLLALMSPNHPLCKRKTLDLADLQPYPLALTDESTTQRQLFDLCCQVRHLNFNVVLTSNDACVLQQFISGSDVITLSSKVSRQHGALSSDLIAIPLSNPELHQRDVQVLTMQGRTLPTNISSFVTLVTEQIALSC